MRMSSIVPETELPRRGFPLIGGQALSYHYARVNDLLHSVRGMFRAVPAGFFAKRPAGQ